jgi:osmoprotectant transport system substrate-binding protein
MSSRRAVLAGFGAATLGLAGCASSDAVVVGCKQFTEEWVLGELYAQALRAKGYAVDLKSNVGSTTIIDAALVSGRLDMYPEYTGTILQALNNQKVLPPTPEGTYAAAQKFQQKRGLTLLEPTPFENKNAVGVMRAYATKNNLKTIDDLRRMGRVLYAEYPDNIQSHEGYSGLVEAYGLKNMVVKPLNLGLQYPALTSGQVQAADVFTTDPQIPANDIVVLQDTKEIFGFQNVAPVVRTSVTRQLGPQFIATINAVSRLLTLDAVRAMNAAVSINRLSPAEVAEKFLRANNLLGAAK